MSLPSHEFDSPSLFIKLGSLIMVHVCGIICEAGHCTTLLTVCAKQLLFVPVRLILACPMFLQYFSIQRELGVLRPPVM